MILVVREQGIGMRLDTFGVVEHRLIELAGISNVFRCDLYLVTGQSKFVFTKVVFEKVKS